MVVSEATSSSTFRGDPDQFAVRVERFDILYLGYMLGERLCQRPERGPGWQVVEMRTYLDGRPV